MNLHHARVRRAQDATLRRSLAGSSLSALTLCVATLLALRALAPPRVDRFAPAVRTIDPDPHLLDIFVAIPDVPSLAAAVGTITTAAAVVPVEETDRAVVDDAVFAPTGPGTVVGAAGGGDPLVGTPAGAAPPPVIPEPDVYVPHDEIPVVVHRVGPAYPGIARDAGMEGRVRVRAFVGVDGRVLRAEAEGAPSMFDRAAVEAVRQWVFTPAKSNGQPVAVWVRVPVAFQLR